MSNETLIEHYERIRKHIQSVKRHIKLVQDACELLGERIIDNALDKLKELPEKNLSKEEESEIEKEVESEIQFAYTLMANGLKHDNSKFSGIEKEHLIVGNEDTEKLQLAFLQHVMSNDHHPEKWGNINDMPEIYLAEIACDWFARSNEAGTDLRQWIKEEAVPKYNMSQQGKAYRLIKKYVDLLLNDPLKRL